MYFQQNTCLNIATWDFCLKYFLIELKNSFYIVCIFTTNALFLFAQEKMFQSKIKHDTGLCKCKQCEPSSFVLFATPRDNYTGSWNFFFFQIVSIPGYVLRCCSPKGLARRDWWRLHVKQDQSAQKKRELDFHSI